MIYYCGECDRMYEVAYKDMSGNPICIVCSAIVDEIDEGELDDILDALGDILDALGDFE